MPFFSTSDLDMFYETFNWDQVHITPIVLIHGFSYPTMFGQFIASFATSYPEYSRFISMHVRGHGNTTTKAPLQDISEKTHVKDIIDLIDYLKVTFILFTLFYLLLFLTFSWNF